MKLGRLEKIDLREYWQKEDADFTPWLALEENIEILSKTIGIELEVYGQEESVGPFRADILCTDTMDNHYVLIENQLEKTDHTHLGQLMTYASGLDAVTLIWIAKKFTDEHRAALDWLNRITDDTFRFFGVEIELYKIGDSIPAPMFKLVSKPNNWVKSVKKSASNQNLTETKILQLEYWNSLKEFMEDSGSKLRMQKARPQHWTILAIGRTDFNLTASVSTRDDSLSVWLDIKGNKAKQRFDKLKELAEEKSREMIGANIEWLRMDDKIQSAVILSKKGDIKNRNQWNIQFGWFKKNLELFTEFFRPLIKKL